ncbi:MAG: site-specific tyrosine recombinase XerD [Planctomycetaceae bacterium]|nr:site-specific tyrosine recombinase XerD [Planctomycetaceae bacterium]
MPPRKRPVTQTQQRTAGPSHPAVHLQPFLHYLRAECGMATNTILAYRNDLQQFLDWLAGRRISSVGDIDLSVLTDYLQLMRDRGLAASTVSRRLVSLKMYFRFLVLEGVITESTVELMRSPKLWQYLPTVLSPDTVDRLLAAPCHEDSYPLRDRALLSVMYATGCRASEVTGLRLKDVNLDEGFCRCVGKGNKERIVSLNPVARSAIEAYLRHERSSLVRANDPDERLFVTRTGRPLTRITVWELVKKYAARIGCSDQVSPHTLRHSFATHMLAGGAEIRALQELLGHASIRTTQVYTQVEHSRLKNIHAACHPRG